MQERVKTSFIPKASLKVEQRRSVSHSPIGIVNVVAGIVLIAAIIAAIGIFLFEQFTIQNIERKRESLDRARAAFEPATIRELSRLNARLDSGMLLLGRHRSLSLLFDEIENTTLNSVRFKDFSLAESGPGRTTISMAGQAQSFNALALQSNVFGKSPFFSEPIFSDFNIDATGNVVFSFSAVVNNAEIAYRNSNGPPSDSSNTAPVAPSAGNPEVTP